MRIEEQAISVNKSITEDMNPIQHWAYVESMVKREVERVLRAHGLTRSTFNELETQAIEAMGAEMTTETEFGFIRKHLLFNADGFEYGVCDRLILSTKRRTNEQE